MNRPRFSFTAVSSLGAWSAILVLGLLSLLSAGRGQVYERLYSTAGMGAYPRASLTLGPDGAFFGTTGATIFKVGRDGTITTLAGFNNANGKVCQSPLLLRGDGKFYGTTVEGGANGLGTVFSVTPEGVLATVANFSSAVGEHPWGRLAVGTDGHLYGTTRFGGVDEVGTVFRVTMPAGTLSKVADFSYTTHGAYPIGGLVLASDGKLYGVTEEGGANDKGAVFSVTTSGVLTRLVSFTGSNGYRPSGGLTMGSDGNLHGVTRAGGSGYVAGGNEGSGVFYRVTTAGVLTVLANFGGGNAKMPAGEPLLLGDGAFYGMTIGAGTNAADPFNYGGMYRFQPAGGLLSMVSVLDGKSGWYAGAATGSGLVNQSFSGLVAGSDGGLYGTAFVGGADFGTTYDPVREIDIFNAAEGTVFRLPQPRVFSGSFSAGSPIITVPLFFGEITVGDFVAGIGVPFGTRVVAISAEQILLTQPMTATGSGSFTFSKEIQAVASFSSGGDGTLIGELYADSDGSFYGVTTNAVYRLSPTGGYSRLAQFPDTSYFTIETNSGGIAKAGDGTFYVVNQLTSPLGGIYKLEGGALTRMVTFDAAGSASQGSLPNPHLTLGDDGALYGTTQGGGTADAGTVFSISPTGEFRSLGSFAGGVSGGRLPSGRLVKWTDGKLYGLTIAGGTGDQGTMFRITPPVSPTGSATIETLRSFATASNGFAPRGGLIMGSDNNFWGTMSAGGANSLGACFSVTPDGVTYTRRASFASALGDTPHAPLTLGSDGNYYGTVFGGNTSGLGAVFKLTAVTPTLSSVQAFAGDAFSAGAAKSGLVRAPNGNLYGTVSNAIYQVVFPGAPIATTESATDVTLGGALVAARVNARGVSTTVRIEYGTDGVNFPNAVDAVPGLLTDSATTPVFAAISVGSEATTRYYRVRATNSFGTTLGEVRSFATLAFPLAAAADATGITTNSATFQGSANARGTETNVTFVWGLDGNSFPNVAAAVPGTVSGNDSVAVSANVGGLLRGQTYYYRLVASNEAGTAVSGVRSFVTLTNPDVTLGSASAVGVNSAQVNGMVNARGAETTAVFEYGIDGVNFPSSTITVPSSFSGFGQTAASATLSGLAQGTTYYFRLKATSAGGGATTASVGQFTTLALPVVSGAAAVEVGSATATLEATVQANGLETSVVFEYGPSPTALPFSVTATPATVSGGVATAVSAMVGGLQPETGYFFRVRAVSAAGEVVTSPLNFIMAPSARAVTGAGAAQLGVDAVVATLNGTVNAFGQATSVSFAYGTSADALTQTVGAVPGTVNGTNDTTVQALLSGLAQGTTYYFRVEASNSGGITRGEVQQFTTPSKGGLIAREDFIFYAGAILIDPLRNDEDPDAVPVGDKSRLKIDPVLVQVPTVSQNVATVSETRKTIGYSPQFNVKAVDTLVYRMSDGYGGSADATVNLITFGSRAGFYSGTVQDAVNAPGRSGSLSLLLGGGGAITTAFANWQGESFRLKGAFDQFGELMALFTSSENPQMTLTVALTLGRTAKVIEGRLVERTDGTESARIDSFTLVLNAGTGGLPEPGLRTAFLSPPAALAEQMGDGYLRMTVSKNRRSARFAGQLPDGEPFALSAPAQGRVFAVTRALEQGGVLTGLIRDVGLDAEGSGMLSNLLWRKPANSRARYHRSEVNTMLEVHGLEYPALEDSALPPIDLGVGTPNARLRIVGGDVATSLIFSLHLLPGSVSGFDANQLKLKVQAPIGMFSGKFRHPGTGRMVPFKGALRAPLDTEPGQGRGVFGQGGRAGSVRIEAN